MVRYASFLTIAIGTVALTSACGGVSPVAGTMGHGGSGGSSGGSGGTSAAGTSGAGGDAGTSGSAGASGTAGGGGDGGSPDGGMDGAPGDDGAADGMQCGSTCPAGTWDLDGNPATGVCGCEYACNKTSDADPIDPSFADDNCDGSDGVVAQCVFVSASLGSAAGAGTREHPVVTIARGLDVARTNGLPAVCVSGEIYNEAITVASGISIYGGFDATNTSFAFRRSAAAVTQVSAPGIVFDAPSISAETHLEGLKITATTPATPGASTYGVRLGGGPGRLFVRYDVITAGKGADGDNGVDGTAPSPAMAPTGNPGVNGVSGMNAGGTGGPQPTCAEFGGAGGPGGYDALPGTDGSAGTGNTMVGVGGRANSATACLGVTGSSMGGTGAPHLVPGAAGVFGIGGLGQGKIASGLYAPADGADGTKGLNGKGGSGGGGGGGGDNGTLCVSDHGGGGGSGGCGGLGGNAGSKGRGGGGSFAVFVAAGTITVTDNQLTTLGGGRGGKGGAGALGQLGGSGGMPGGAADDGGAGGMGGAGSAGGAGAPGGGGGGGPSICVARGAGTTILFMSISCSTGTPGAGGVGGASATGGGTAGAGSSGSSGENVQLN